MRPDEIVEKCKCGSPFEEHLEISVKVVGAFRRGVPQTVYLCPGIQYRPHRGNSISQPPLEITDEAVEAAADALLDGDDGGDDIPEAMHRAISAALRVMQKGQDK